MFHYTDHDLPIKEITPQTQKTLAERNNLILSAPPGAGKSTLLPLALLDQPWLEGRKIIMLEPRRLAAKSIAERMAELLGEKTGHTIGYRIRFETRVSEKTQLEVVTEGILTRMLQSDNELSDVGLVIFDEYHERSIHADLALALCREAQKVLRPDLRILVMSATLNVPMLEQILEAPSISSEGKMYPVDIEYTGDTDRQLLPELVSQVAARAFHESEGDMLVFLPGQGEIMKTAEMLRKRVREADIRPLYGNLPFHKQTAAIRPGGDRRKIVLATSIAETSLTIEGVTVVVDSGLSRISQFDPGSGLMRLATVPVTLDAADQRAGRAGRLRPGKCFRMWSLATHDRLKAHRIPEIEETDLSSLVLELAAWGVEDVLSLDWVTPPPRGTVLQASELLHELEALEDNKITEHGRQLLSLPTHPRLAHMLLMAEEQDQVSLAADLAALLEERDPLPRESGTDITLRVQALRRFRERSSSGGRMQFIKKVSDSYHQLFKVEPDNGPVDDFETGLLLAYAYPERIACSRPGNNAQFQLANGKIAQMHHSDDLAHEPWIVAANLDARDGMGKIFLAAPIQPTDLRPLIREKETILWHTKTGGLQATKDLRIGSIVLQSTPLDTPDRGKIVQAISDAVSKEGQHLLDWNERTMQLLNRVESLRRWNGTMSFPEMKQETLLETNKEWLLPYLENIKKPEELKKIDLFDVLYHSLSYEKQQELDQLAPERLEVPTGSKLKLEYFADERPPVLAVRIQEIFGMASTPMINAGKQRVLLHLLSPGYKPVQVTDDLENFWKETYFEVRKELKRRYPKHKWPENPGSAMPERK